MPYIEEEKRKGLAYLLCHIEDELKDFDEEEKDGLTKGDLNYLISHIVLTYLDVHGISYSTLSDMTGMLNDVKVELERRVVAPYEDKKIEENGDIYNRKFIKDKLGEYFK